MAREANDGVELRIDQLDPLDGGVDQFQRRDVAGPDQGAQPGGIVVT